MDRSDDHRPGTDPADDSDLAPTAEFRAFLAGDPLERPGTDRRRSGWLARLRSRLQRERRPTR